MENISLLSLKWNKDEGVKILFKININVVEQETAEDGEAESQGWQREGKVPGNEEKVPARVDWGTGGD